MQYILLDPYVLYLTEPSQISKEAASQYLRILIAWSEAVEKCRERVSFGISSRCRSALERSSGYPDPLHTKLSQLINHHNLGVNVEDIFAGCRRFFETFLESHAIDEKVGEARAGMDWEAHDAQVIPDALLMRLRQLDHDLAQAFQETLTDVAFARGNDILPVSALREVYIGSSEGAEAPLEVTTRYSVLHESADDLIAKEIKTLLPIRGPDQIEAEPPPRTFLEAIAQVERAYPNHIVISDKAKDLAARAPREITPLRLKELLSKLVTVWLESYQRGGGTHDQDYWRATGKRCAQDESSTAKERFPEDYTVIFEGQEVFCGRHVIASYSFRINFQVVDSEDGTKKILVARIGEHGRNKMS